LSACDKRGQEKDKKKKKEEKEKPENVLKPTTKRIDPQGKKRSKKGKKKKKRKKKKTRKCCYVCHDLIRLYLLITLNECYPSSSENVHLSRKSNW